MSTPDERPALHVVRGRPTTEDLAALVAVLAARRAGTPAASAGPATPSAWRHSAGVRGVVLPGPGAWRRSGLPLR